MQISRIKTSKGFTIVELMIATAVFSLVLLLCATAVVQIGQMFYKGVTINRTQDTARRVADDMIQSIQFGGSSASPFYYSGSPVSGIRVLCLGSVRYTYAPGASLGTGAGQMRHVLWKDRLSSGNDCVTDLPSLGSSTPSAGGTELLAGNMRVPTLTAPQPAVNGDPWVVTVIVAYGEDDESFTDATHTKCKNRNQGGQFCAVSTITSNVLKRL